MAFIASASYADEVRSIAEVEIGSGSGLVKDNELKLAVMLVKGGRQRRTVFYLEQEKEIGK